MLLLYCSECGNLREEGESVQTGELHLCDRKRNWIFSSVRRLIWSITIRSNNTVINLLSVR